MRYKHVIVDKRKRQWIPIHRNDETSLIPLASGEHVIIDTEDCDKVSNYCWYKLLNKKGGPYALACLHGRVYALMHRLLLNAPKDFQVDHINGNGLDNRKINLRLCTCLQNCSNRRKRLLRNSSKYRGVSFRKDNKMWIAQIQLNRKKIYIGQYKTEKEAYRAWQVFAKHILGEFYSEYCSVL